MIDKEKALEIAQKELEKFRQSASNYEASIEPYAADPKKWIIWFEWKSEFPIPGGRNAVVVDRETGESLFMQGE